MSSIDRNQKRRTARLRQAIERRECFIFWGQRNYVTPMLVNKVFGDGRKLIAIYPINYRPHHFVVRIGSDFSTSNWPSEGTGVSVKEWLDDVCDEIEDQFVEWPWKRKYGLKWPKDESSDFSSRINWGDGCAWEEIRWPRGFNRAQARSETP